MGRNGSPERGKNWLLPVGSAASRDPQGLMNARTTVWGWFKGGLDGGEWGGGFYVTDNAKQEEAVTLQHGDFKECMVPN